MKQFDVRSFIPRFLWNDQNCHAMAKAIQSGLNTMNTEAKASVKRLTDIDQMPSWRLDDMLWEMNLTPEKDVSDAEKRNILRSAYSIKKNFGTHQALQAYLDSFVPCTWIGKRKNKTETMIIMTDDGLTAAHVNAIQANVGQYLTMTENVRYREGQSICLSMRTWCDMDGYMMAAETGATSMMRRLVTAAMAQVLDDKKDVVLTIDGTEKLLNMWSSKGVWDETVEMAHYMDSSDVGKALTKYRLQDTDGNTVAERSMASTELIDANYYTMVYQKYNSEPGPEPSLDMSDVSTMPVLNTFSGLDSMTSIVRVRVVLKDGRVLNTSQGSTKVSVVEHGVWAIGFRVTFNGLKAGDIIDYVQLIKASSTLQGQGTLMVARPDNTAYGTVDKNNPVITFYVGAKYGGDPVDNMGKMVIGISAMR